MQAGKSVLTQGSRLPLRYGVSTASEVPYQAVQYQSVGKSNLTAQQVFYNGKRGSHIFRSSVGHVQPKTVSSQNRFVDIYKNVASNSDNLCSSRYLSIQAKESGVNFFSKTSRNGKEIWVHVRDSEIQNAGVNLKQKYIYK